MLCDGRGFTLAGGYQVGLRLFQGGVVAGGQGKVGVRVVRDGLVVSLNGPDEHGEVLLVQAFLTCYVDPLELQAAFLVFSDHLNHLAYAPVSLTGSVEGCQALLDTCPEALIMLHLREVSGEVTSDESCEENKVAMVEPQPLAGLVEGILGHLVQDVVGALKLERLLRGLQGDLILSRRSSVHLLQVDVLHEPGVLDGS